MKGQIESKYNTKSKCIEITFYYTSNICVYDIPIYYDDFYFRYQAHTILNDIKALFTETNISDYNNAVLCDFFTRLRTACSQHLKDHRKTLKVKSYFT